MAVQQVKFLTLSAKDTACFQSLDFPVSLSYRRSSSRSMAGIDTSGESLYRTQISLRSSCAEILPKVLGSVSQNDKLVEADFRDASVC